MVMYGEDTVIFALNNSTRVWKVYTENKIVEIKTVKT